jgi:SAM-dependent methyltransferase
MDTIWTDLHKNYTISDWIDKPSLFAETAIAYFPAGGKVLDLGAGQGQDSRYFAERGHDVVSTDIEASMLATCQSKLAKGLQGRVSTKTVDLRDELPFGSDSFDVVYAHLSLHYFDYETTVRLFSEIERVLRPGGVLACLVNSTSDPEYRTGTKLDEDYFQIGIKAKRFFSISATKLFARYFDISLLDDQGETYKDQAKDVHQLIRFIGINRAK